jgi:glutamate racemase
VEAVPGITKTGHVGILATPATVSSESYVLELEKIFKSTEHRIQNTDRIIITQQACPMWVPLIEAGEHKDEGADYFVEKYLREILAKDPQIDTLVLGCTHYPLLKEKIERFADRIQTANADRTQTELPIQIIAQGDLVAKSLADYLKRHGEYREQLSQSGTCTYLTTENAERFSQTASQFIGSPVRAEHVSL